MAPYKGAVPREEVKGHRGLENERIRDQQLSSKPNTIKRRTCSVPPQPSPHPGGAFSLVPRAPLSCVFLSIEYHEAPPRTIRSEAMKMRACFSIDCDSIEHGAEITKNLTLESVGIGSRKIMVRFGDLTTNVDAYELACAVNAIVILINLPEKGENHA